MEETLADDVLPAFNIRRTGDRSIFHALIKEDPHGILHCIAQANRIGLHHITAEEEVDNVSITDGAGEHDRKINAAPTIYTEADSLRASVEDSRNILRGAVKRVCNDERPGLSKLFKKQIPEDNQGFSEYLFDIFWEMTHQERDIKKYLWDFLGTVRRNTKVIFEKEWEPGDMVISPSGYFHQKGFSGAASPDADAFNEVCCPHIDGARSSDNNKMLHVLFASHSKGVLRRGHLYPEL